MHMSMLVNEEISMVVIFALPRLVQKLRAKTPLTSSVAYLIVLTSVIFGLT